MFYAAEEDLGKIQVTVGQAAALLLQGVKKAELDVELGDEIHPIEVTGYWVNDLLRIDVKRTA